MIKLCNSFLRKWRFLLLLLLVLLVVNLGHVRASEKSPPEDWQLQGMLAALDDSDPNVLRIALYNISQYNLKPPVEIPPERVQQIVDLLNYDNWSISILAADAVGQMGIETEELILQLQKLLNDNNSDVRRTALSAVGRIGSEAKVFIPQLQKLLNDNNSDVRRTALSAVGQIGVEAKDLIPQVQKLLDDNNSDVRITAAKALIQMGVEVKELIPQLKKLLSDNNPDVREMTLTALVQMGVKAKELIPQFQKLLSDNNSNVRVTAIYAVGAMRSQAKDLIPQLQKLSKSNDSEVSRVARRAMGQIISEAKEFIPILQKLSTDENPFTRMEAADILASMNYGVKELIPQLQKLLTDDNPSVRLKATHAVGWSRWDYNNQELTPYLQKLLTDNDENVRNAAAFAVSQMGSEAKVFTLQVIRLLSDDNEDTREYAAKALSRIGSEAKELIPQLDKLLGNDSWITRAGAAEAVGQMGFQAQELIPQLEKLLEDDHPTVRREAAEALGQMGSQARDSIPKLLNLLADGDLSSGHTRMDKTFKVVRPGAAAAAATAISRIRKLNTHEILQILNVAHRRYDEEPTVRFVAYFVSGGEPNVVTLIQWLGSPQQYPYQTDKFNNTRKEGKKVLEIFADAWPHTENLEYLRPELERQIDFVVKNVDWQLEDLALLKTHYNNLKDEDIRAKIVALQGIQWLSYIWKFLLFHAITWLILLSLYPKSPEIQTLFWNPLIRRIAGLGYVGLLLTWIPFLRRRLLSPFQPLLIADANLDSFDPQNYFPDSNVCLKNTHNLQPIKTAIAKVQSPIILEGESGLGKSMFLRYWAKTCKNLVVYLPASKCAEGAIAAIQAKIPISQTDGKFLENLIYNNALEICIDGLNEVTPDTRTKISYFVERHFRGHILLATQPLVVCQV